MLINLARREHPAAALEYLLTNNDEDEESQDRWRERAVAIQESLVTAGVIEVTTVPGGEGGTTELSWRLVDDLQVDFALNQPLSTFALAAVELLDVESETYALDVLSVIEATLEDPRPVVFAQRNRARGEAVAQMKADGIEYEERMELLEDITWPKPLEDVLETAYDIYAESHPWVLGSPLRPKSVAREIYELAMTFTEYISYNKISAAEGIVLRYLADAYKALRSTVPEESRDEELDDIIAWLGELVRQVDSSLLDEWEQLVHPAGPTPVLVRPGESDGPPPITANARAFRVLVRNAMFRRVELAALRKWSDLGELDAASGWDAERWESAMAGYFAEYDQVGLGPAARGPHLLAIESTDGRWRVRQTFDDPAEDHDWGISAEVDLAASDERGEAVIRVVGVDSF